MQQTQDQVEAEARLLAAEAEYLTRYGWDPLAPMRPGGQVRWLSPPEGPKKVRNAYSQGEAMSKQRSWGPRNSTEVRRKIIEVDKQIELLMEMRGQILRTCTHESEDGMKTTIPVGGGFARCTVCDAEID